MLSSFSRAFAALVCVFSMIGVPAQASAPPNALMMNDHYFGWDTLEFSVDEAVALIEAHPILKPHRALIIDRLGFRSINPRLLPLFADLSDTLAMLPADPSEAAQRIDAFIGGLARMYHLGRSTKFAPKNFSAASVMSMNESDAGLRAIAETFVRGNFRFDQLTSAYMARHNVQKSLAIEAAANIGLTAAPTDFLRLPWTVGQTGWSFNGVHSNVGGCSNAICADPRSAIDFSRGWPVWGTSTTNAPVLAANAGTVSIFSSCNIRVSNANGWATNYYHLANLVVTNGQNVVAGQPLGQYADNQSQALCQGGKSTGPHTHILLIQGGAEVAIDQSEFSGWRINATSVIADYDSNTTRMNLTRSAITACAYSNSCNPTAWAMHTLPLTAASSKICDLDIDGSGGALTPESDGALLTRYLLGFRGNALVDGLPLAGATRTTSAQIEAFIATKNYDLKLDGGAQTSIDGLIATRYMRGVTTNVAGGTGSFAGLLSSSAGVAAYLFGCR